MKLTFRGTRGNIDARTALHYRHTALLVSYRGRDVMIDCGADWRGELDAVAPQAVVVTHAHPDHALGLQDGARCPVHASVEAWQEMKGCPVAQRRVIRPRRPGSIAGITFEAFPVEHSTRAPACGYRVSAGRVAIFYVPDVVFIKEREAALAGVRLFIGDGDPDPPADPAAGDRLIDARAQAARLVQGCMDPPGHHHSLRQRHRHGQRRRGRSAGQGHG